MSQSATLKTGRTALVVVLVVLTWGLDPVPIAAQSPSSSVEALRDAHRSAETHHLWRVAAWGGLNALGGVALAASGGRRTHPTRWGFGAQSAAWGVINVGIAATGLIAGGAPPTEPEALLSAERTFHDILLFNLGLNVAYSGVGAAMVVASYRGVEAARAWRGHGSALILQGAGLLVLDAIAFFASRTRLAEILRVTGDLSARALPTGVVFTLSI